jgi:hypothetical protein
MFILSVKNKNNWFKIKTVHPLSSMTLCQDPRGLLVCYLILPGVHKLWVPGHPGNHVLDGDAYMIFLT